MVNAIVQRLVLSIPVLFGVLLFGFLLMQIVPGDPALVVAGPSATPGRRPSRGGSRSGASHWSAS